MYGGHPGVFPGLLPLSKTFPGFKYAERHKAASSPLACLALLRGGFVLS